MSHSRSVTCFCAYPSRPTDLAEANELAFESINSSGYVTMRSWKELHVTGRLVIREICKAIEDADMFMCDLTFMNANVLFELGYAIAKRKRVWIILNDSYEEARKQYKDFNLLSSVGYAAYHNADQIFSEFMKSQPFAQLEQTLYRDVIELAAKSTPRPPSLLYLKSLVDTDASVLLSRRIHALGLQITIDDPSESSAQTLQWYVENVLYGDGVLIHLLDDDRVRNQSVQNSKYSFAGGLAHGLEKPLLFLAHMPFNAPFDYQDLLQTHSSAKECIERADPWLSDIKASQSQYKKVLTKQKADVAGAIALRRIQLGDHIAENEINELPDYFVETASYQDAISTKQAMIFVGRKGSGKTANLYQLEYELRRDKRNHVCVIKPIDYDIEAVLRLVRISEPLADRGYMLQSLWKYLVYTQLAASLYAEIGARPLHVQLSDAENALVAFVEAHRDLVLSDFALRMENAITQLCELDFGQATGVRRTKVSEILHDTMLGDLRQLLGDALAEKRRVVVLFDNLDKAWQSRVDLIPLSEFLFALLSVSRSIAEEFQRTGLKWREVDMAVIVFLRSDIFTFIMSQAREADKVVYSRLQWNDPEQLKRVVEERFQASLSGDSPANEIWSRFFIEQVDGQATSDYIIQHIIPRPRDVIYFCRTALSHAVNRNHSQIEEADILSAQDDYSIYAYYTLVAETKPYFAEIESLLLEFAASPEIIDWHGILALMEKSSILPDRVDILIELLTSALFLGLEISQNDFRYLYDDAKAEVIRSRARSYASASGTARYRVNIPFHRYLEIRPN